MKKGFADRAAEQFWSRNHIVDEIGAHGAGITEIVHLHGTGAIAQNFRAGVRGITIQIDGDIHFAGSQEAGDFMVASPAHIEKMVERLCQASAHFAAVVGARKKRR